MDDRTNDRSELDEYVARQLEQHYGKEAVRSAAMSSPPPPPKRKKQVFSAAAVLCAVAFITGALMLAGVLFTGGIPTKESPSDSSSNAMSSYTAPSSAVSSQTAETSLPESSADSEVNSTASSEISTSSEKLVENSSAPESASQAEEQYNIGLSSRADIEERSENAPQDEANSRSEKSLPETVSGDSYTEESYIIESDPNNNSETNPYDNVTTGRQTRAGVGVFLMLASLGCAAVLYNLYNDKENDI